MFAAEAFEVFTMLIAILLFGLFAVLAGFRIMAFVGRDGAVHYSGARLPPVQPKPFSRAPQSRKAVAGNRKTRELSDV